MANTASAHSIGQSPADEHGQFGHVVPVAVLLAVFVCLAILTVMTVGATRFDLGGWNLWIAMGIATIKAALVALYFMHLRYDHPFNALIFVVGVVVLGLFISLTLLDTQEYSADIENWQQGTP